MEGAPLTPEYNNDDFERREKHKPKVETIGSFAVETNPERDPDQRQYSREHLGKTLISKEALEDSQEVNYEQDPVLRHAQQNSSAVARVSSAIGSLLSSKSDLDLGSSPKTVGSQINASQTKSKASGQARSLADMIMLSIILLLLILIIIVIIFRA